MIFTHRLKFLSFRLTIRVTPNKIELFSLKCTCRQYTSTHGWIRNKVKAQSNLKIVIAMAYVLCVRACV